MIVSIVLAATGEFMSFLQHFHAALVPAFECRTKAPSRYACRYANTTVKSSQMPMTRFAELRQHPNTTEAQAGKGAPILRQ
jgi:hypothetical protein